MDKNPIWVFQFLQSLLGPIYNDLKLGLFEEKILEKRSENPLGNFQGNGLWLLWKTNTKLKS